MSKATVSLGHNDFVLDINDAVTLMEIMSKAENYKAKTDYNVTPSTTAYYVWEQEVTNRNSISAHSVSPAYSAKNAGNCPRYLRDAKPAILPTSTRSAD